MHQLFFKPICHDFFFQVTEKCNLYFLWKFHFQLNFVIHAKNITVEKYMYCICFPKFGLTVDKSNYLGWLLGAIRPEIIISTSIEQVLWCQMASLVQYELIFFRTSFAVYGRIFHIFYCLCNIFYSWKLHCSNLILNFNFGTLKIVYLLFKVVLENSCRADEHDCPFARASIEITNMLTDILKVGEQRKILDRLLTFLGILDVNFYEVCHHNSSNDFANDLPYSEWMHAWYSAVITRSNLSRFLIRHSDNSGRKLNQILVSQQTPHISPGVSIARIREKIDRVITAPYCILSKLRWSKEHTTCLGTTVLVADTWIKCPHTEMPHPEDTWSGWWRPKNDITMKLSKLVHTMAHSDLIYQAK